MSHAELDNLVKIAKLKAERYDEAEYQGLVKSAQRRLADARNEALAPESRFDLAYNASHRLALAALRYSGYRPSGRYLVFQTLEHTVQMPASKWRVLSKCHDARNLAEYEGQSEIDAKLLAELVRIATELEAAILTLPAHRA